jgi:hypothetical protein
MHRHTWVKTNRPHGLPDHFFVECSDPECKETRQAAISHNGYHGMVVYTTGTRRTGKSKMFSFRLDLARAEKLRRNGIDVRKVMEEFIDSF